jgi:glycosyltransferase involved in cell wall biosynthesis
VSLHENPVTETFENRKPGELLTVAVLVDSIAAQYGGPTYSVRRLWQSVHASGARVTVHSTDTFHVGETANDRASWQPLECRRWPTIGIKSLGYSARMTGGLLNSLPRGSSIISQHGLWRTRGLQARTAGNKLNAPVIVHPHGMLEPWTLRQSKWKKRIAGMFWENENLRRAACIRVTSQGELKTLRDLGFKTPVAVIPNGVDVSDFANLPSREEARRSLPQLNGQKLLFFLSRVHPKKGLPMLLRVWKSLGALRDDWMLLIAGPDEYDQTRELEQMIRELDLKKSVTLSGPLFNEEKLAAYALADLFVLPSYSENFGIAVAEALASGLPVITTKNTPWRGLTDHRCGWWIDANEEVLGEALREAISLPPAALSEMGSRGRDWMQRDFSWDRIGKQMIDVCRWTLGNADQPDCVSLD